MDKSKFQFTNPTLTRLEFEVHNDFLRKGKLDMGINLSVNCRRAKKEDDTLGSSALVMVTVSIGTKDNSTPFYIEADEEATFRWCEGDFSEANIEALLNENAVALLISYLRPIIANVTASSPYPCYNLPFLDLTTREKK